MVLLLISVLLPTISTAHYFMYDFFVVLCESLMNSIDFAFFRCTFNTCKIDKLSMNGENRKGSE